MKRIPRKIIKIGSSHGIIIPKVLLEMLGLEEGSEVEIQFADGGILVKANAAKNAKGVRWDESKDEMVIQQNRHFDVDFALQTLYKVYAFTKLSLSMGAFTKSVVDSKA